MPLSTESTISPTWHGRCPAMAVADTARPSDAFALIAKPGRPDLLME